MSRTMIRVFNLFFTLLLGLVLYGCSANNSDHTKNTGEVLIYAATSLSSVLPELAEEYQAQHPHVKVEFNLASSSILAKQIEHGADADIYFSAHVKWAEYLVEKGFIKENSLAYPISNQLVLVTSAASTDSITLTTLSNPEIRHIAMGDWAHVPAGIYAQKALSNFGIWEEIEEKCLPAMDVRAALAYVERGDAECGIVYKTDAMISSRVKVIAALPEDIQPRIVYAAAILKSSNNPDGEDFFAYIQSVQAKQVFERFGFKSMSESGKFERRPRRNKKKEDTPFK